MKKHFSISEFLFAVIWIVLYYIGFYYADFLSEIFRAPGQLPLLLGLILSVILFIYLRKGRLLDYYGFCDPKGSGRDYLWFIPLVLISTVNLWTGIAQNENFLNTIIYIFSMFAVGFLEELIFRGLLFKSLSKANLTLAIVVSTLTFGASYILELFSGHLHGDVLLLILSECSVGFCYTILFYVGGSILPCILSHAFYNATYILTSETTYTAFVIVTVIQILMCTGYGIWLLCHNKKSVE